MTSEQGKASVLVVEDERIVAIDLKERLEHRGYHVPSTVPTGESAVEQARLLAPDLILMDIKLQGEMDGISAAAQIHEDLDVPIVFLTAFGDDETLARAQATDPYGYLLKPFAERELEVAVEMALFRHRLVKKLAESEASLSSALRARDEMLAMVSHDLRNPLTTVLAHVEALLRPSDNTPERVRRLATGARRAAIRMQRLIGDLLDVSRLDKNLLSLDMTVCRAGDLVADAIDAFQPVEGALCQGARLVVGENSCKEARVTCDRDRIAQVLSNLIANAQAWTSPQGTITVSAAGHGKEVWFSVADTGSGIAPEELPHVFQRFRRGPGASHSGAGLGLYISKGIIDAHGGRIWAESEVGRGSTFHFTLPIAAASAPEVRA